LVNPDSPRFFEKGNPMLIEELIERYARLLKLDYDKVLDLTVAEFLSRVKIWNSMYSIKNPDFNFEAFKNNVDYLLLGGGQKHLDSLLNLESKVRPHDPHLADLIKVEFQIYTAQLEYLKVKYG
jgi:hypothetical protein